MARTDSNSSSTVLGLQNEAHVKAFAAALAGKPDALEALLCRAAGWPGGKLNMKLAAAFGAHVAATKGNVLPLLSRFGDDDAMTNTPRVFLPVCAAFGWAAMLRVERDVDEAWQALCLLGADGRHPIQRAVREALVEHCAQAGTDGLMTRAVEWLDIDDRELRYGVQAMVLDLLSQESLASWVKDRDALPDYLTRVIDDIAEAPRAAERSEMRRRALKALPGATAAVAVRVRDDAALAWLSEHVQRAKHPGVREALSDAIALLRKLGKKQLADQLEGGLQQSATPPRDPTRVREGVGRSKKNRRNR